MIRQPVALDLGTARDREAVADSLDAYGNAVLPHLLTPAQCADLIGRYEQDERYRSRVIMARHGFGAGEYRYFAYPLPELLGRLRADLYEALILKYGVGDYNCLHQDLYGEHVFPLQVAVLLAAPGEDFDGGEFVMTEVGAGSQGAEVVPLGQGDAVVVAVNTRPARGVRGFRKVSMRHGVSRIRRGDRHALSLIFHYAT